MQIGRVTKEVIDKNIDKIEEADIILMQLEIPIETIKYICKIAKRKKIVLDPAPADIKIMDKDILENVFIIKPNETELELLTNMPTNTLEEVTKAGSKLLALGAKNVIVSLGKKGAVLLNSKENKYFPAVDAKVVDTTAAGDSFIAGVTLGLAKEKTIEEAIDFASKIASITVSKQGAQTSIPTKEEVENIDK